MLIETEEEKHIHDSCNLIVKNVLYKIRVTEEGFHRQELVNSSLPKDARNCDGDDDSTSLHSRSSERSKDIENHKGIQVERQGIHLQPETAAGNHHEIVAANLQIPVTSKNDDADLDLLSHVDDSRRLHPDSAPFCINHGNKYSAANQLLESGSREENQLPRAIITTSNTSVASSCSRREVNSSHPNSNWETTAIEEAEDTSLSPKGSSIQFRPQTPGSASNPPTSKNPANIQTILRPSLENLAGKES